MIARRGRSLALVACLIALFQGGGSGQAMASTEVDIHPHLGFYKVSHGKIRQGSPIAAIDGVMSFEWGTTCDTVTVEQRFVFDSYDSEGNGVRSSVRFSSWEAVDGLRFGFSMTADQADEITEEFLGTAALDGPGLGGRATYRRPQGLEREIPPGTLFPTTHVRRMLTHAAEGRERTGDRVFLGQREDDPLAVSIQITPAMTPEDAIEWPLGKPPQDEGDLIGGTAWRFHQAYFTESPDELPIFEVLETIQANGVVREAEVLYSDFSIRFDLVRLEERPKPSC